MERKDYIQSLFEKYLSGDYNQVELDELLSYFDVDNDKVSLTELIAAEMEKEARDGLDDKQVNKIANRIEKKLFTRTKPKPIIQRLVPWLSVAALLCAAILILYKPYFQNSIKTDALASNTITDVKPGRNAATLTLADGKKILLNDASIGDIAAEQGITVTKTKYGELVYTIKETNGGLENKINTLSTANGETYQIVLSDGTKVWLNAATTLQYSANLGESGKRRVKLIAGEAYFEVSKDKAHPFIVENALQKVEVLGTHFNINSYADEGRTVTTLAEGLVKVSALANNANENTILKPGEQSLFSKGEIKVQKADLQTTLAWKDGRIYFKDAPIQEVLRQVSRWYNIQVEYDGEPTTEVFNGGFKRSANLSSLLRILELSNVQFELSKNINTTILKVKQSK